MPSLFADIRTPEQAAAIAFGCLYEATSGGNVRHAPAEHQQVTLFRTLYKTDLDLDEGASVPNPAPGRKTHIDNDETEPALYMFNNETEGFVIVAADTRARDVLGYSVTGTLTDEDIAPGFMWLMERFVEEISSLTDADDAMASPSRAPQAPQSVTPIEPLLGKIEWGQGAPYNNSCPIDSYDNTRCVTGCVATAAAQIMCYWRWPETTGTGSHSYTWKNQKNGTTKTLSFNYGNTTFDWDNMLPSYKGDYTTEQVNAVAKLMYACGVAVNMKYGGNSTAGSASVTDEMAPAMVNYFRYQYAGDLGSSYNNTLDNNDIYSGTTTYAEYYKTYFNDDLENGRPILMSGSSAKGGHAFVCDGRDADNNFHINWGWTGSSNCYTPLTAIRPGYPKHNDLYFKTRMYATYGLRPNSTCLNTTTNTTDSESEDNLPYVWRGQEITATGVYKDVETDAETGCTKTYVLYFTARPAGTDGMCGDNLFYDYNATTKTLTITGSGSMWEYDYMSYPGRKFPWDAYKDQITTINLSDEADTKQLLTWLTERGALNITISRTLYADGGLNTLCLPFSLTQTEVQTFLPNATLYAFSSAQSQTGELLIWLQPSNSITAGVPYLVRFPAEDPDIVSPTFTGVQITAATGLSAGEGEVTLNGILGPKNMIAYNTEQLMVGADDRLFWADVDDYMKGFRAYFQVSAGESSPFRRGMPARVVMEAQTPTDVEQTSVPRHAEKVLRNGQLIIRANGIEYNAQGQKY